MISIERPDGVRFDVFVSRHIDRRGLLVTVRCLRCKAVGRTELPDELEDITDVAGTLRRLVVGPTSAHECTPPMLNPGDEDRR